MPKEYKYAAADVFFASLVGHFVGPVEHEGKLIHSILSLLNEARSGLESEYLIGDSEASDGLRVGKGDIASVLRSKVLLKPTCRSGPVTFSSTQSIPRGDGRRYEQWTLSFKDTTSYGEPLVSCTVPLHRLSLSVALPLIRKMGQDTYCKLVQDVFAVCSEESTECASGFVDIMSAAESSGGRCYSPAAYGDDWCGWHRLVELLEWGVRDADRYQRVQGVFWANYLGRTLASKLGDADRIIRDFDSMAEGWSKILTHKASRCGTGLLFLTSNTPLDLVGPDYGDGVYEARRAIWLRERFRKARIL